jgi:hypothetical protein
MAKLGIILMRKLAFPYYEARLTMGLSSLLPVLGLPSFALLTGLFWRLQHYPPNFYEVVRAFEILLPLAGSLAAAHLFTIESEEGFDELRRSYPEPWWKLTLSRISLAVLLAILSAGLGALVFHYVYGPYSLRDALAPALPPALFLTGLSLLASILTRNYWVAAAVTMGYWFLELQTRGKLTTSLYLFQHTLPSEGIQYAAYADNRLFLVLFGLAFIAACLLIASLHRKGFTLSRKPSVE